MRLVFCLNAINHSIKILPCMRSESAALCGLSTTCGPLHLTAKSPGTTLCHNWRTLCNARKCIANKRIGEITEKEKNTRTQKKNLRLPFYVCVFVRPQTHNHLPWSGLRDFCFCAVIFYSIPLLKNIDA